MNNKLVLLAIASVMGMAAQSASATTITDRCMVITAPGDYLLTQNATRAAPTLTCFDIRTSNVTLDLGGHTIRGDHAGVGVITPGLETRFGIKVINGTIADFDDGINMPNAFGAVVQNINSSVNNVAGIRLGNGALVQKSTVSHNGGDGINVGAGSAVTDSTLESNKNGVVAGQGSLVKNIYSGFNTQMGILIQENTAISEIHGNLAEASGKDGIRVACPAAVSGNPVTQFFPNKGKNFVVTIQDVVIQLTPIFEMQSVPCVVQKGTTIDHSSTPVDQTSQ